MVDGEICSSSEEVEEEEEEEEEEGEDSDGSITTQQLQTLKSLLPNATKTDKRSILEETRDYLLRIHQETEKIEKQLSQLPSSSSSSSAAAAALGQTTRPPVPSQELKILRVEIEELMERRFVVKISWRNGSGVASHVQRVIECLDVKMTSIVVKNNNNPNDDDEMMTTAFVKVKKDTTMTEEEIYHLIRNAAARFGYEFPSC